MPHLTQNSVTRWRPFPSARMLGIVGFLAPDFQILVDVSVNPWAE